MKAKAVWFSRHAPTPEQLTDAQAMGYEIVAIDTGRQLGAMDLRDNGDVVAVVSALLGQCAQEKASAIFGVAAAPIQGRLARTANDAVQKGSWTEPDGQENGDVPFFSAWNVQRSADGGKPTFAHRAWLQVGRLSQASLRWCR